MAFEESKSVGVRQTRDQISALKDVLHFPPVLYSTLLHLALHAGKPN